MMGIDWDHRYLWTTMILHVARIIAVILIILGLVVLVESWKSREPPLKGDPYSSERDQSIEIQNVYRRVNRESLQTGAALLGGGILSALLATIAIAVLDLSSCMQEESRMNAMYRRK